MISEIRSIVEAEDAHLDPDFLELDASLPPGDLTRAIDDALSRGCVVLVRNYLGEGPLMTWDNNDIRPDSALVTPHCKLMCKFVTHLTRS